MDCLEVKKVLLASSEEPDGAMADHLRACPACQLLAADGGALARELTERDQVWPELPALGEALDQQLQAESGWLARLRELKTPVRLGLAVGLGLLSVLFGGVALLREDFALYPGARMTASLGLLGLLGLVLLAQRLRPVHRPPAPRGRGEALVLLSLLLLVVLALLPAAHLDHPDSVRGVGEEFVAAAVGCAVYGTVFALPLALLLLGLRRRTNPGLWLRLFSAGAAALLGNLVLLLHCPITMPLHLLVGHALLGLLYGVVVLPVRRGQHGRARNA